MRKGCSSQVAPRKRTRKGTPPNPSAQVPTWPNYKGKPCKYYNEETKTWNQPK